MVLKTITKAEPKLVANGRLTCDAVTLYEYSVTHPDWTIDEIPIHIGLGPERLHAATGVLRSLQLFRRSPDPSRVWDAVSPEAAIAELLADEELELDRRQTQVIKIRSELSCLIPTYFDARRGRRSVEAIDVINDVETIGRLLTDWSQRVNQEVCVAHPGGGMSDAGLARSVERDMSVLHRGVLIRTVLQNSVRHHAPTRHYVSTVAPLGAKIRTVPIVPRRLIIFDREVAFVPLEGGRPERGAAVVKEPAIVDYLFTVFELMWTSARPFVTDSSGQADGDRDELWRPILNHLSVGAKDDAIAHRLGLSVRTCRRHIAAIMEYLGANSRFQAGLLAQQRGMLSDEPI